MGIEQASSPVPSEATMPEGSEQARTAMASGRTDVRSESREALAERFREWGESAYRLDQVLGWLYARRAASWDEMTNLPRSLRSRLADLYTLELPELLHLQGSRDTTRKFLWRLGDGSLIESVLIPANPALYGDRSDRHTLCISTQVGCAYGCRFCASGLDGWKRNLHPHEIAGQILAVERWNTRQPAGERIEGDRVVNNIVVMGMGEPMANYVHLMAALRTLNAPWGGNIGARKITLSTSGVVPRIRDLAEDPLQFRLAISLHGATDDVRNRIMPVNRKYPVAALTEACRYYVQLKGRMITLEYILIAGVNDDPTQVPALADLAHNLHAKVNLIPYNTVEGLEWVRPTDDACHTFARALRDREVTATLRLEKGHDIDAACGQLRLKTERELTITGPTRSEP
ncbi:MAG: 23S rRNA (adenine(2503)-C(2))-methyltransferase RlmN [Verrucomicrobiota bacterium]